MEEGIVEIWIDEEAYYDYLEEEFEDFDLAYDGIIEFEEWRLAVDIDYREKYGVFPLLDSKMMDRLPIAAADICLKLIDDLHEEEMAFEKLERFASLRELLLKRVGMYLGARAEVFDLEYPHRNRFQRLEIFAIDEIKWEEDDDTVNEALDSLVDKGFLRLIEHGGKSKYDTFQLVEV